MLDDKFIKVEGSDIYYIEEGEGTPVLLFHGARFNSRVYEETGTVKAIMNSNFRAISVDFPGFGKSFRIDIPLPDFIDKFMDAIEIRKAIMLGASMGGEAVIGFAVSHPDKVKALILAGAVGVSEYEGKLSSISGKPMLLMWGRDDVISSADNYRLLMRYNKNAEFHNVGSQHACYLDDSKAFNAYISGFLSRLID